MKGSTGLRRVVLTLLLRHSTVKSPNSSDDSIRSLRKKDLTSHTYPGACLAEEMLAASFDSPCAIFSRNRGTVGMPDIAVGSEAAGRSKEARLGSTDVLLSAGGGGGFARFLKLNRLNLFSRLLGFNSCVICDSASVLLGATVFSSS